jgi:AraC-like DNA-binding protein
MSAKASSTRTRRRVDWSLILRAGEPLPSIHAERRRPDVAGLASAFQGLSSCIETDELLRRAVELARDSIGVQRAAIFLIDPEACLMRGTWGTDLERRTVDEHHVMCDWSEDARAVVRRATENGSAWAVLDNCPIVEQLEHETRVLRRSWVGCTPIFSGRRAIGIMFNDTGKDSAPVDSVRQGLLAILCAFVGVLLAPPSAANELPAPFKRTSRLVAAVVKALAQSPSLSAATLARDHGVSVSRLARAFKAEMGMSIVQHRNALRLRRFFQLAEEGADLLSAALAAGFGSYAQFHRVFRAEHAMSPGVYLGLRSAKKGGPRQKTRE